MVAIIWLMIMAYAVPLALQTVWEALFQAWWYSEELQSLLLQGRQMYIQLW